MGSKEREMRERERWRGREITFSGAELQLRWWTRPRSRCRWETKQPGIFGARRRRGPRSDEIGFYISPRVSSDPPFLDENRNQNSFQLAKPGSDSLFDLY